MNGSTIHATPTSIGEFTALVAAAHAGDLPRVREMLHAGVSCGCAQILAVFAAVTADAELVERLRSAIVTAASMDRPPDYIAIHIPETP